ncbi:MAG: hypothetical protein A2252_08575 [Elusimicrobia bacterium RIFOXYA2_FULL_39_19]|nr:MAG: hypothetical protein A2252_08575 [Elusimicrobia bacterium RIFOXYA2_FULL_39_19]
MNCKKCNKLISKYHENRLSAGVLAQLEQHIHSCEACANEYQAYKQLVSTIKSLEIKKAPEHLKQRVKDIINNDELLSRQEPAFFSLFNKKYLIPLFPAAVAAVILMVVLISKTKDTDISGQKEIISPPAVTVNSSSGETIVKKQPTKTVQVKEPVKETAEKPDIQNAIDNSLQTMLSKGVEAQEAKVIINYAIENKFNTKQLEEVAKSVTEAGVSAVPEKPADIKALAVTGKEKKQLAVVDTEFKFKEAVPNPFTPNGDGINDKVVFNVNNPNNEEIEIKIFELKGFLIRTLIFAYSETPLWDGTNNEGRLAEGGIYIFQLKAGNKIIKGTIVLAK